MVGKFSSSAHTVECQDSKTSTKRNGGVTKTWGVLPETEEPKDKSGPHKRLGIALHPQKKKGGRGG